MAEQISVWTTGVALAFVDLHVVSTHVAKNVNWCITAFAPQRLEVGFRVSGLTGRTAARKLIEQWQLWAERWRSVKTDRLGMDVRPCYSVVYSGHFPHQ